MPSNQQHLQTGKGKLSRQLLQVHEQECQQYRQNRHKHAKQSNPRQEMREKYNGMNRRRGITSTLSSIRQKIILCTMLLCFLSKNLPSTDAFRIMDWIDGDTPIQLKNSNCADALSLSEISELRVRELKYKLQRKHGYGSDEVYRILDKKELVNTLAHEEHKICEMEIEWKKKVMMRRSIVLSLVCVVLVMFWPLFHHAWEVGCVNFVVYTDRKRHEISRCRDLKSYKGGFGIFLMSIVDCLKFWLTLSVMLSWVMTSKYFFPIPRIPIRPAAILDSASGRGGGNNPLAGYGINVGPMVISFCFGFVNGRIERWLGRVLSEASKRRSKELKEARKAREWMAAQDAKQERKAARAARRAEREARRQAAVATEADPISSPVNDEKIQGESSNVASMRDAGQIRSTVGATRDVNDNDSRSGMNDLD